MTFREFRALVALYEAAPEEARARAVLLVPELAEWGDPPAEVQRRYRITAYCDGLPLGTEEVICRQDELPAAQERLRADFPLARGAVTVTTEEEVL